MATLGPHGNVVHIEGLKQLRTALRRQSPDTLKEVRVVLKDAAGIVARRAAERAPRRTGALAESIKAGTAGNAAIVRSNLPYAPVHEYGGTIKPRGAAIKIKRSEMIEGAMAEKRDEVEAKIMAGLEAVAIRNGWR